MVLSPSSWHARLYVWTATKWLIFRGYNPDRSERFDNLENTNLCRYIRTLFVLLPLLGLIQTLALGALPFVVFVNPILLFGSSSMITLLIIIGCTAAFIGAAVALFWAIWYGTTIGANVVSAVNAHLESTEPGIFRLTWQWFQDRHDNLCSTIKLVEAVPEENSNA